MPIGRADFRWEGFQQTDDLVLHLLGGTLMGIGGVLGDGLHPGARLVRPVHPESGQLCRRVGHRLPGWVARH
jgi:hypothetical protein